jgi:hypothetical protein
MEDKLWVVEQLSFPQLLQLLLAVFGQVFMILECFSIANQ